LALVAVGGCGGGGNDGSRAVDTAAPSVPQSVTATAESATQVRITWNASTDTGSGVAGYHVYRDGASAPIATITSGTTHTDTGLVPSTQYSYSITAFDGANPTNESAASTAVAVTTLITADQPRLVTERVFVNLPAFQSPVLALQAPGDGATWYVVEQQGRVLAFEDTAAVGTTRVFVDLTARVQSGGETGLLGMAFHPSYPTNPRVYLSYTAQVDGTLVSRISTLETRDGGATLDPSSEAILLTVAQPSTNHNGGNLAFGPHDGLLYVGFGDGGGAGDPWGTIGNGQDLNTVLGKLLRIDVDGATSPSVPYRIPQGNPYAGNTPCNTGTGSQPCPEIFALGFRNPWRWSFDRTDHELWVGDVGQGAREEVNRVVAGGNYGWRCLEGTLTYNPDCGPNAGTSQPPVAEYDHSAGRSITGGYVYRGAAIAGLQGHYVFGDFITGMLWHIAGNQAPTRTMTVAAGTATGLAIASFAEDAEGELYIVDYGGTLQRVRVAN
jgi:glucose/arabinose dehydrogenase